MINTIESNKLFAEFVGEIDLKRHNNTFITSYKYDTDWNWLMRVLEKIETIEDCRFDVMREQYCVIIKDSYQMIEMFEVSADTKIEALYNACVKFVKWYNKTLEKQEKFKFLFGG